MSFGRQGPHPRTEHRLGRAMEPLDVDLDEGELELPAEPMHLNMGPSHPAMHGTVRIVLELSGETIVKADVQVGYLHRGFEKMCERGHLGAGLPVRRPAQLRVADAQQRRLRAGGREAVRPRRARSLPVVPHGARRAGAHQRSPDVHRRHGDGARRVHAVPLVRQGARDGLGHPRRGDGRPAHALVRPRRRDGQAADARLQGPCARAAMPRILAARRGGREDAPQEPHLHRSPRERRADQRRGRASRLGWTGPCLRSTGVAYDIRKTHPYLKYDEVDFDVPVGTQRRHARPLPRSPRRDPPVQAHHRAVARAHGRRRARSTATTRASCSPRRWTSTRPSRPPSSTSS